jgi:IS5 family transposase
MNIYIYIVTVITKIFKGHSKVNLMRLSTQDASFVTSDHGKHGRKKPPAPDMPDLSEKPVPADREDAKRQARRAREEKKRLRKDERRESMMGRSRDGSFAQKDGKNFFGYKQHSSHGVDMPLVRESVITSASVHDSQVDLSISAILHKS